MKTTPTSAKETSTPANSGPASVPTLSTVEVAALAAMSSSGVLASDGSSACSAGLISVDEIPMTAANTNTRTCSAAKAAAADAASAPDPTSVIASRKRSRRKRSPRDAANGATAAAGSRRTRPATPTAAAPPRSYANTPSATKCAHSAPIAAPHASSTRRTLSFRTATSRAETTWPKRNIDKIESRRCSRPGPRSGDRRAMVRVWPGWGELRSIRAVIVAPSARAHGAQSAQPWGFGAVSGGGGIRTHGRGCTPSPVFKTGAFGRSATPPAGRG